MMADHDRGPLQRLLSSCDVINRCWQGVAGVVVMSFLDLLALMWRLNSVSIGHPLIHAGLNLNNS